MDFNFKGICNVEQQYNYYFQYLLGKLNSIFKWEGLPDTVDENFLNSTLFLNGMVAWFKDGDNVYALNCAWGGKPDEYYVPEDVVIANPILGGKVLKRDKEAVVMLNGSTDQYATLGLRPLLEQYATLLADNLVSINCAQINSRVQAMAVADSPNIKNSAEAALKRLYDGKPYTVIEQDLLDKITINPLNQSRGQITELIDLHNYILANFYKSVGIMDNEVNKKERLITDEINSQENAVSFNIFDMLKQRVKAIEKINELFGTDIKVMVNPIMMTAYEDREENITEVKDVLEPKDDVVMEAIDSIDEKEDFDTDTAIDDKAEEVSGNDEN